MTELNVPVWAFLIIWFTLILGAFAGGWFLRGLWDRESKVSAPPPPEDEGFGNKRGKW